VIDERLLSAAAQKNRTPANRLTDLTKSIASLLSIKVFRQSRMPMREVLAARALQNFSRD
jgi:hypothetical protein